MLQGQINDRTTKGFTLITGEIFGTAVSAVGVLFPNVLKAEWVNGEFQF